MRKPKGYAFITEEGNVAKERDTFTCSHCQRVVFVRPLSSDGAYCRGCMGLICPKCEGLGCTPWEKTMETMERRNRLYEYAKNQ